MDYNIQYDVFISYRRDGGEYTARVIYDKLKELGYSVFFDVESLRSGDFNTKLYDVIDNCKDFIIVLSPGALDRCVNGDDWVKNEIEYAIKKDKNIVPILLRGFAFPDNLPESISTLPRYNGIEANSQFFDAFISKLQEFFKSRPSPIKNFIRKPFFIKLCICLAVTALAAITLITFRINDNKKNHFREYVVSAFTEMGYSEETALLQLEYMDNSLTPRENLISAFSCNYSDTADQVYSKMTHLIALEDFDGAYSCVCMWQNKAIQDDFYTSDVSYGLFLLLEYMAENGTFSGAIVTGYDNTDYYGNIDYYNESSLMPGDIIIEVNGEKCVSAADYKAKMQLSKDFYNSITILRPVYQENPIVNRLDKLTVEIDNSMQSIIAKDIIYTDEIY